MSEHQNDNQNDDTPHDSIPPEEPYNASQPNFYSPPPYIPNIDESPLRPLPLEDAVRQLPSQYIRVLTNPGAAVFAQEQGKAAWNIVWVQIMITGIAAILVGMIGFDASLPSSLTNDIPVVEQIIQKLQTFSILYTLRYVILTPILFFVSMGFYQLFARAFGGRGSFLTYCYTTLLFAVPIGIISDVFNAAVNMSGLPSQIGSLVVGALSTYGIILRIFATMATHRLSGGKATWAVLILPILIVVALIVTIMVAGVFLYNLSTHMH